jgi:hypothetical protein
MSHMQRHVHVRRARSHRRASRNPNKKVKQMSMRTKWFDRTSLILRSVLVNAMELFFYCIP